MNNDLLYYLRNKDCHTDDSFTDLKPILQKSSIDELYAVVGQEGLGLDKITGKAIGNELSKKIDLRKRELAMSSIRNRFKIKAKLSATDKQG